MYKTWRLVSRRWSCSLPNRYIDLLSKYNLLKIREWRSLIDLNIIVLLCKYPSLGWAADHAYLNVSLPYVLSNFNRTREKALMAIPWQCDGHMQFHVISNKHYYQRSWIKLKNPLLNYFLNNLRIQDTATMWNLVP